MHECFEAERAHLLSLPDEPFPAAEQVIVRAHKTPYVQPNPREMGRWG